MEPLSEKRYLELHAPAGGDFLAARERLLAALPDGCRLTLGCLQQLYPVLSAADYRVTVTLCPGPGGTDAVRVEPGDTTAEHYGLCLDIGSTIMQMELVDLVRGRTLSQAACTNSQTQFGANILDRILAVKADRENLKTLQALTLSDVRGMIDTCCRAADIFPREFWSKKCRRLLTQCARSVSPSWRSKRMACGARLWLSVSRGI